MQIIGPDLLVFGVDDVPACHEFLTAYGLEAQDYAPNGAAVSCRSMAPALKSAAATTRRCRPR
ncbi:hypothetical protein [Roseinatronobacter sp. S2]|uniref:hypothetical protein n=1 Tax=Roseinatronobacter sp. S2 TaxID=3035471 RepID=UPI00240F4027|nr:hypothetical protein [Roseinatronobacter sp. S2]WFE74653.1 hypothetical protein P8S53_15880 [Roseinatronobacter sp. S2]